MKKILLLIIGVTFITCFSSCTEEEAIDEPSQKTVVTRSTADKDTVSIKIDTSVNTDDSEK